MFQEEEEKVKQLCQSLYSDQSHSLTLDDLNRLAQFECWLPLYHHFKSFPIKQEYMPLIVDTLMFLKEEQEYQLQRFSTFCHKIIDSLKLDCETLFFQFLQPVLGETQTRSCLEILENVIDLNSDHQKKIPDLLFVARMYDKRLHNHKKSSELIAEAQLLDLSHEDILLMQKRLVRRANKQQELYTILDILLKTSTDKTQEAAVLEKAQLKLQETKLDDALSLLKDHSFHHLNPNFLMWHIYFSKKDWQNCLNIAQHMAGTELSSYEQAILFYQSGMIHLRLKNLDAAKGFLNKALQADNQFLKPYLELVRIAQLEGNMTQTRNILMMVIHKLKDPIKSQLISLNSRLARGQ